MADENTTSGTEGTEDLTGLKSALATEREARKQAEKNEKAGNARAESAEQKLAKLESDGTSEAEKAIAKARKEGSDEARTERDKFWSQKFVRAEVKAAAAQKLADPDDIRLLDLDEFTVNEDGSIKGDINAAVDKLIESKPHLAAGKGTRQEIDQGAQGGAAGESIDAAFGKAITDAVK